jgi:hypothetical protein
MFLSNLVTNTLRNKFKNDNYIEEEPSWRTVPGVQSKNNEYHIVNKVENQSIYEWILKFTDNVVCVHRCFIEK